MALLATVAALVVAPVHHSCDTGCQGRRYERQTLDYRLRHACNHSVLACIDRAARLHNVSAAWMRGIAWCESRMNPMASNGTHFGLFQYDWQTWTTGPYAGRGSPYSAKWSSLQTAWYLRNGQASRWVCA